VRFFRFDYFLTLLSAAWVVLLLYDPGLVADRACLYATVGLLAVNFAVSLGQLIRKGRVLILLNLAQLPLFCILNYQLFRALGPGHYRFETAPGLSDWIGLAGAHFLRALDVLDGLEEYGFDLQNIEHNSALSGAVLVWMHLVVDVFIISLIFRGILGFCRRGRQGPRPGRTAGRPRGKPQPERRSRWPGLARLAALAVCGVFIVRSAVEQGWPMAAWFLWPLDNFLRTVDIGDMFQIFHWRLHGVRPDFWTATLAMAFRVVVGIYVAAWINYLRIAVFSGRGVTVAELVDGLDDPDHDVRVGAARALGRLGPGAREAVPALIKALSDPARLVRLAATEALGQMGPAAEPALASLRGLLTDADAIVRRAAPAALGQIGPPAAEALVAVLDHADPYVCEGTAWALGQIGPAALPALVAALDDGNARARTTAAQAMGEIGAPAVSALAILLDDVSASVRAASARALGQAGAAAREALPALGRMKQRDNLRQCRHEAARALRRIGG